MGDEAIQSYRQWIATLRSRWLVSAFRHCERNEVERGNPDDNPIHFQDRISLATSRNRDDKNPYTKIIKNSESNARENSVQNWFFFLLFHKFLTELFNSKSFLQFLYRPIVMAWGRRNTVRPQTCCPSPRKISFCKKFLLWKPFNEAHHLRMTFFQ